MKYIDADKLIAEIEKRIRYQQACIKNDYRLHGKAEEEIIAEYKSLSGFINNLLEEQDKTYCKEHCKGYKETGGKCFFGFNCSAKKVREQSEVDLKKEYNYQNRRSKKGEIVMTQKEKEPIDNILYAAACGIKNTKVITKEEKELLLKDLCARLPYGVKLGFSKEDKGSPLTIISFNVRTGSLETEENENLNNCSLIRHVYQSYCYKPYLRPMSSMTEDEKEELLQTIFEDAADKFYIDEEGIIDGKPTDFMKDGLNGVLFCPRNVDLYTKFLHSHHLDYRGLIPMGLALEAPDGMYEI